jgi:putative endonuclease
MANPRHALGEQAEETTARWLEGIGWRVLDRRWRIGSGELDLVCRDPAGALVAVEVKLRRTGRAGTALEAVDPVRLHRLRRALAAYAHASARSWPAVRVDLVTVTPAGESWLLRRYAAIDAW